MKLVHEDGVLRIERPSESREHRSLHGLTRTLVANMVTGVTTGSRAAWRSTASATAR